MKELPYDETIAKLRSFDSQFKWFDMCYKGCWLYVWSDERNLIDKKRLFDEAIAKYGNEFILREPDGHETPQVGLTIGDWLFIEPKYEVEEWRKGRHPTILLEKICWDIVAFDDNGVMIIANKEAQSQAFYVQR